MFRPDDPFIAEFNRDLLAEASASEILAPFASRFTTVPIIMKGTTALIGDGLHYSDGTLAEITDFLIEDSR